MDGEDCVFKGFRPEAVDFFLGIRLNNNEAYYREHLKEYEREIKEPMRALNDELEPVIHAMDPQLDTRPGAVLSRLRRDTRFSKDKSQFRDHAWMGWRYPGERRSEGFHMWWGFGPEWMGWGCGEYSPNRTMMDRFRNEIRKNPDEIREIFNAEAIRGRYAVTGLIYQKMKIPEDVPEDLRKLYVHRSIGLEYEAPEEEWEQMHSPDFKDRMIEELHAMYPLTSLMTRLRRGQESPEPPAAETETEVRRPSKLVVHTADEFEF